MRLLELWIVFMVLLVVFVPAFSMIYSPPAMYTPSTSECPPCPECPPPPQLHFPRIYPWWARGRVEEDYTSGIVVFHVNLRKLVGYKYFILVNLHLYNIAWAEYCTGEYDDEGFPICDYLNFRVFNSTHSYAFVNNNIRDILIEIYAWGKIIDIDNVYVVIIVVPEHYTLQDVLRDLQRVTTP